MARIIDNKLLFIHTPKTGGTFVREVINMKGIPNYETGLFEEHDHLGIQDFQHLRHLHSFGCIRKPYNYIISRWSWAMYTEFAQKVKGGTKARNHWMADIFSKDINEFLSKVITHRKGIVDEEMVGKLAIGKPMEVDTIFKCEEIRIELPKLIFDKCGFNIEPFMNQVQNSKKTEKPVVSDTNAEAIINAQNPIISKFYE